MTQTDSPVTIPSREWLERKLGLCLDDWEYQGRISIQTNAEEGAHGFTLDCFLLTGAILALATEAADHIWGDAAMLAQAAPDMRLRDAAQDAASWLRAFGWNRYGIACQDDFHDHAPILAALDAAVAAHSGEATESGCPCLVLPVAERCSPQCSCARPHMSGGCRYCARYGSMEQRLVRARLIAQAMP